MTFINKNVITFQIGILAESVTSMLKDFGIQCASLNNTRDSSSSCRTRFQPDELIVMITIFDGTGASSSDGKAVWYHLVCFASIRLDFGWYKSGELFPGYNRLEQVKKDIVKNQIP